MDQSRQQPHGTANTSAQVYGLFPEVSPSVPHSDRHQLMAVQFLAMLEPSFALVRRLEQDQPRLAAERELKLQQQLELLWQRIGRLERQAQKSEADKALLERLLREVVNQKLILVDRVQQLEVNQAAFHRRLDQTEGEHAVLGSHSEAFEKGRQSTGGSSTSPETAIISANTPGIPERDQEVKNTSVSFTTPALDATKLHPMLPSVLFIIDPESKAIADGSDFPLSMLSSVRSILTKTVADGSVSADKLAQLRNASSTSFSIKSRCLYRYLNRDDRRSCVWTREHAQCYACRTCVNKQRLCMSLKEGQTYVLPLHPLLRIRSDGSETRSTELEYWVAAKGMSTAKPPYNVDIWSVPAGQH